MSTTDSALKQRLENPVDVVSAFLDRLRDADVDGAAVLMSADIRYRNVSLPTITTRERVRRIFAATLGRPGVGFDVVTHSIAAAARGAESGVAARAAESGVPARAAESGAPARAAESEQIGTTVLTERTDELTVGRLRVQFWVCGRFDVTDGEITAWTDYFDWGNVTVGLLRGLVGMVVPAVQAELPPR